MEKATSHFLAPSAVATAKRELFLLAARTLADRGGQDLGDRFTSLVGQLAITDDTWVRSLIDWTRRQPALRWAGCRPNCSIGGGGTPASSRQTRQASAALLRAAVA
ncbi:hypothetical protein [Microbispora rosea]|uniref:hypothetical protein n=1 Tax=Microbispora rosea TaxID=58117 RepID=UPI003D8A4ED6